MFISDLPELAPLLVLLYHIQPSLGLCVCYNSGRPELDAEAVPLLEPAARLKVYGEGEVRLARSFQTFKKRKTCELMIHLVVIQITGAGASVIQTKIQTELKLGAVTDLGRDSMANL